MLRIDISSSNRVPRATFLHLLQVRRKERGSVVDSGASLHMRSKNDLTPEEQETVLKSNDPPVRPSYLTKNGRDIECKTDHHIPFIGPRRASN